MHFSIVDVQTVGIGISAFLATLIALFIFFSAARTDKTAHAIANTMLAVMLWAWFGFLYAVVENIPLARDFRDISVIGIIWLMYNGTRFAQQSLHEIQAENPWEKIVTYVLFYSGCLLTIVLAYDLSYGRFIVGDLLAPSSVALAPQAGPYMWVVILYHILCLVFVAYSFLIKILHSEKGPMRRASLILGISFTCALALGLPRYTGWYGFDFYPLLTGIAVPLFVVSAFYAMKKYSLFSVSILATQLLLFVIWSITFLRVLLDPNLVAAIPDIGLFIAVLVLGVLLMRSSIREAKAQQELARLTLDQGKYEFVTIAAHQLRTPLAAVRWAFSILLQDKNETLSQKQREVAQQGSSAADHMMTTANDLLNTASISEGKFSYSKEPGDLRETTAFAVKNQQAAAHQKNISIAVDLPPACPNIAYDHGKFELALENILDNAIKYTPAQGKISVALTSDKKSIKISVSDTGIGIPPGEEKRLFEKFFRGTRALKAHPDGSGLGLFIAKTIVEGHGGTIEVAPNTPAGSVFTIVLPGV